MAKKFKFKLEGLLKLRKIKEDVCKQQLGKMQQQLAELEKKYQKNRDDISEANQSHTDLASSGVNARKLSFYPYFIDGKDSSNKKIQKEKDMLLQDIDEKTQELAQLKNQHKLIDNMKDEKKLEHKKQKDKKDFENLEELSSIRRMLK